MTFLAEPGRYGRLMAILGRILCALLAIAAAVLVGFAGMTAQRSTGIGMSLGFDDPRPLAYALGAIALLLGYLSVSLTKAIDISQQMTNNAEAMKLLDAVRRGVPVSDFVLYLRPFSSDHLVRYERQGGWFSTNILVPSTYLDNEAVAIEVHVSAIVQRSMPMVRIGGREVEIGPSTLATAQWREDFRNLASRAKYIIVLPLYGKETAWEINYLRGSKYLDKTLLLMPPSSEGVPTKYEWELAVEKFQQHGIRLPSYTSAGQIFRLDEEDGWKVIAPPSDAYGVGGSPQARLFSLLSSAIKGVSPFGLSFRSMLSVIGLSAALSAIFQVAHSFASHGDLVFGERVVVRGQELNQGILYLIGAQGLFGAAVGAVLAGVLALARTLVARVATSIATLVTVSVFAAVVVVDWWGYIPYVYRSCNQACLARGVKGEWCTYARGQRTGCVTQRGTIWFRCERMIPLFCDDFGQ